VRPRTKYWLTAAVVVPALVALVGIAVRGGAIEQRITDEADGSLASAGDSAASVVIDGRDVTLVGVPYERIPDAVKAVRALPGVNKVSAREPALGPLTIDVDDQQVVVSGTTQEESWRRQFVHVIGEYVRGRTLVDHTSTSPGTDFAMTTTAAAALVSVLTIAPGARVDVSVNDGQVVLDGVQPDASRKANTTKVLGQLFGSGVVVDKTRSA
jgi:hypothetical protein